jgi:prepilin-type N-terminal cleavage/methylation domain-containing protein
MVVVLKRDCEMRKKSRQMMQARFHGMGTPWRQNYGFTLVEVIVVIIILGILAAVAIPQFVSSTQDAKEAVLRANLANWRKAIQHYYHEHGSTYPGAVKQDGSGDPTADAEEARAANREQLKWYTNKAGGVSTTLDRADYPLGPYLPKELPRNPLRKTTGGPGVKIVFLATPIDEAQIDDTTGFVYSPVTGEIRANTTGYLDY